MTEQRTPDERERDSLKISNRISHFFLGTIAFLAVAAAAAYVAAPNHTGGTASSAAAGAPAPQMVTVAMHDPGCHWFQTGSGYSKSLKVTGPINLRNLDEAALLVASNGKVQKEAVGQQLALDPGSYRITMVDQASDDNTLNLTVN